MDFGLLRLRLKVNFTAIFDYIIMSLLIVQYCNAHDRNYAQTAEQYQVSYQQARNYIVKYEAGGVEAFKR